MRSLIFQVSGILYNSFSSCSDIEMTLAYKYMQFD